MKTQLFCTTILVILQSFTSFAQDYEDYIESQKSFEHQMLLNLTNWKKYKRYTPPSNGRGVEEGVHVMLELRLQVIEELDEKKQQLTSLVAEHLRWRDMRLAWNASDYDRITRLVNRDFIIWRPALLLANKVIEVRDHQRPTIVLYNDGRVVQFHVKRYHTTCPLDFRKFPFDEQKCDLYFMQEDAMRWSVPLNLTIDEGRILRGRKIETPHPVWDVVGASAKRYEYTDRNRTFSNLRYTFNLKRRGHYYTYMFVSPAVMLALLTPVLFLMPTEGTVRFTLGGALLISICIILLMLEEELPATHTSIPALGVYYGVTFVLVCLSLVLGTLTHNISTKSVRLNQPPAILKTMLLSFVGRLLCVPYDKKYGVGTTDVALGETDKQGLDETDQQTEWRLMAMALDRILFIIFFVVIVITSFALLL